MTFPTGGMALLRGRASSLRKQGTNPNQPHIEEGSGGGNEVAFGGGHSTCLAKSKALRGGIKGGTNQMN